MPIKFETYQCNQCKKFLQPDIFRHIIVQNLKIDSYILPQMRYGEDAKTRLNETAILTDTVYCSLDCLSSDIGNKLKLKLDN